MHMLMIVKQLASVLKPEYLYLIMALTLISFRCAANLKVLAEQKKK